jgi:crotonobetainyl-CoA:carnitine CoA-transferase CaiB-like acyl-CoA transferase
MNERRYPLEGVVVLDMGQIYNGPYASLLLALGGATVIKVEPPHGDNLRGRTQSAGAGAPFVMLNSNKQGVTLNLRTDRGRELLKEMADKSDVLIENFRPGVMERLGVGADVLMERNPRLIFASGSGFGQSGPYRDFAAMDLTVQAMAGIMATTGFPDQPPVKAGPAVCDFFGGIHLYGAISTALFEREKTGVGRHVEASMFESVYPSLMSSLGLLFNEPDIVPPRTGNRHSGLAEAPYNVYEASEGFVAIICVTDAHWRNLAKLMGREDLGEHPDYATRFKRVEKIDEIDELVNEFTRKHPRDPLCALLREGGVPCSPVRDINEVVVDPHLHERGMLREIDHPELGRVTVPHSPLRYDGDSGVPLQPSPSLGQHNEAVFCDWLGLSREELDDLVEKEVV